MFNYYNELDLDQSFEDIKTLFSVKADEERAYGKKCGESAIKTSIATIITYEKNMSKILLDICDLIGLPKQNIINKDGFNEKL